MKKTLKIATIVIIILALLYGSLNVFMMVKGKDLLTKKLQQALKQEVSIGHVVVLFPANLIIKNIEVKGLVKAESVFAGAGAVDVFRRDFYLSQINVVRPHVTLTKSRFAKAAAVVVPTGEKKKDQPDKKPKQQQSPFEFFVGRIHVVDGTCHYIDDDPNSNNIAVTIEHVNVAATNISSRLGGRRLSRFSLTGDIPWQSGNEKGVIAVSGWTNFHERQIQAKATLTNVDAAVMQPYIAQWLNMEEMKLQHGRLNFSSDIQGKNTELIADCNISLSDIAFKKKESDEKKFNVEKFIGGILQAAGNTIQFHFRFKTKLPEQWN
ncbi:MAG: DUF748 domain-containing protein [Candidatus Omnitrophica bacterium]|nr:DUF748 domain-containing protein [Candidatus Omnitrophota bacterium]